MASDTYDLFFTGRDDPRGCLIIGEDTKPIYFCFETAVKHLSAARTIVSRPCPTTLNTICEAAFALFPLSGSRVRCMAVTNSTSRSLTGALATI